jgi:hypothetical protein
MSLWTVLFKKKIARARAICMVTLCPAALSGPLGSFALEVDKWKVELT